MFLFPPILSAETGGADLLLEPHRQISDSVKRPAFRQDAQRIAVADTAPVQLFGVQLAVKPVTARTALNGIPIAQPLVTTIV